MNTVNVKIIFAFTVFFREI